MTVCSRRTVLGLLSRNCLRSGRDGWVLQRYGRGWLEPTSTFDTQVTPNHPLFALENFAALMKHTISAVTV